MSLRPESLENLVETIKRELGIQRDFTVQYADPDFGGEMITLTNVNELPDGCGSVQLVYMDTSFDELSLGTAGDSSLPSTSGESSHDTVSVSSTDDLESIEAKFRQGSWPSVFELPKFSPELDRVFEDGNAKYKSDEITYTDYNIESLGF